MRVTSPWWTCSWPRAPRRMPVPTPIGMQVKKWTAPKIITVPFLMTNTHLYLLLLLLLLLLLFIIYDNSGTFFVEKHPFCPGWNRSRREAKETKGQLGAGEKPSATKAKLAWTRGHKESQNRCLLQQLKHFRKICQEYPRLSLFEFLEFF